MKGYFLFSLNCSFKSAILLNMTGCSISRNKSNEVVGQMWSSTASRHIASHCVTSVSLKNKISFYFCNLSSKNHSKTIKMSQLLLQLILLLLLFSLHCFYRSEKNLHVRIVCLRPGKKSARSKTKVTKLSHSETVSVKKVVVVVVVVYLSLQLLPNPFQCSATLLIMNLSFVLCLILRFFVGLNSLYFFLYSF